MLSDDQLGELGRVMAGIDALFPVALDTHTRDEVLLDMEFKIDRETEGIKIKQIRPFLRNTESELGAAD